MNISYNTKKKIAGYIFLAPVTILIVAFLISPMAVSFIRSFTNWSGFSNTFKFIGLRNYIDVFTDSPEFWHGMWVSFRFAIYTLVLQVIIGFLMAYAIYYSAQRLQSILKVLLYMPVIMPATAVGLLWMFMYSPDMGLINSFLRMIGLDSLQRAWIGDYSTALGAVVVANTWRYAGFTMMLYLIALQAVPKELLEAAEIDGATKFQVLKKIFIPLTITTTEINAVISFAGSMRAFDMFYITTQGGPGDATMAAGIVIYNTAFQSWYFSKALVMSLIMFLFILIITLLSRKFLSVRRGD